MVSLLEERDDHKEAALDGSHIVSPVRSLYRLVSALFLPRPGQLSTA